MQFFFHVLNWQCWKMDKLSTSQTAILPACPRILSDTFTKSTNARLSGICQRSRGSCHIQEPGQCIAIKQGLKGWTLPSRGLLLYLGNFLPRSVLLLVQTHLRFSPSCSLSHEPTFRKWDYISNKQRHLPSHSFS